MKSLFLSATLAIGLVGPLAASSRGSADYQIVTESVNDGGLRTASADYANDGSLGGGAVAGTSGVGVVVAKAGFIGQLTEVAGLLVTSPSTDLPELGTLQLGAAQLLDDATTITLPPAAVRWSISSGPLGSISVEGLATAAAVYLDTPASVQGLAGGFSGSLNLTVRDTLPDNFGAYAGDGIDDSWQVQYFGLNNPEAAPNADASGTGQTNLFKFVAGLNPLDPNARFVVSASPVAGQATQKEVRFSPVVSGRTYTIRATADLSAGNWMTLSGSVQVNGSEGTFLDSNASGVKRFYEVQITKP